MTKSTKTGIAAALIAVSCSRGASRIETRALARPNPTRFAFPLPLVEVRARALEAFSIQHQIAQPVFGRADIAMHLEPTLSAECASNSVFGKDIFRDPTNAQDIYLHSFHSPFVISPVYRGNRGGLPFIASFDLHLTASGPDTVVTVTASDAEVINGTKWGFGSCGPGLANNYERVGPTTVEEYTILRYLGAYLGVTNMQAVILPAR